MLLSFISISRGCLLVLQNRYSIQSLYILFYGQRISPGLLRNAKRNSPKVFHKGTPSCTPPRWTIAIRNGFEYAKTRYVQLFLGSRFSLSPSILRPLLLRSRCFALPLRCTPATLHSRCKSAPSATALPKKGIRIFFKYPSHSFMQTKD